jgi:hypothetical protein
MCYIGTLCILLLFVSSARYRQWTVVISKSEKPSRKQQKRIRFCVKFYWFVSSFCFYGIEGEAPPVFFAYSLDYMRKRSSSEQLIVNKFVDKFLQIYAANGSGLLFDRPKIFRRLSLCDKYPALVACTAVRCATPHLRWVQVRRSAAGTRE